jgi:hypothetical protein
MAPRTRRADAHRGAARVTALVAVVAVVGLALGAAAAEPPTPIGPCGPVARPYDVVEVVASDLHRLGGTPLARLGLLAFRDGKPMPIPFQVDEKRGRKIALPGGEEPTVDDKPDVLDAEDLLVFAACDAGDPADASRVDAAAPGATWREIRLDDPVGGGRAFAYVVVSDHPPVTARRYVEYDPSTDLVTSGRYRIGLVSALPNYFALVGQTGVGPNLIDGIRLRAEATLRADLAHWKLNEQQGQHELIAWKTGPVRIIRRSRHHVVIGLGIRLTAGVANTYFGPQSVYGPGSLKLPFSPGVLFRDISAFGGVDGRDLRGWRYYAEGTPAKGLLVDGHMDAAENAFRSTGDWFVLAHHDDALLFVTRMSENLRRTISLALLYRDDAERANPPEQVPGTVPLVGYEGRGIEKLPGGRYTFALRIFALPGYRPGDERRVLAEIDASVKTSVTAEGGISVPAPRADARPAPR